MPMNANEQPSTDALVNFLLKQNLEKIAVVIMTPPLEICQTEPEIKFKEM